MSRIQIPIKDLEQAMYDARETSYEAAVSRYIEANPRRIRYWLTGKL